LTVRHVAQSALAAPAKEISGEEMDEKSPGKGGGGGASSFWGWIGGDEEQKKKEEEEASKSLPPGASRARSTTTRAPLAREMMKDLYDESDREPFASDCCDLEVFLSLQRANGRWLHDSVFVAFLVKQVGIFFFFSFFFFFFLIFVVSAEHVSNVRGDSPQKD
jgi:hypothetical protein